MCRGLSDTSSMHRDTGKMLQATLQAETSSAACTTSCHLECIFQRITVNPMAVLPFHHFSREKDGKGLFDLIDLKLSVGMSFGQNSSASGISCVSCRFFSEALLQDQFKRRIFLKRTLSHGKTLYFVLCSGDNLYIFFRWRIKSLGASRKKPPDVSLDKCIEYGQRVSENESGYYFMDSPGNDLESIAGQVASGCNVIFFVTGNGVWGSVRSFIAF